MDTFQVPKPGILSLAAYDLVYLGPEVSDNVRSPSPLRRDKAHFITPASRPGHNAADKVEASKTIIEEINHDRSYKITIH